MDLSYILNSPDVERVAGALETIAAKIEENVDNKVSANQGKENAGKALVVGSNGIVGIGDAGIPDTVKSTLLAMFRHVVYADENAMSYYRALRDALYDTPDPTPETYVFDFNNGLVMGSINYEYMSESGGYYNLSTISDMNLRVTYHKFDFLYDPGCKYVFRVKASFVPSIIFHAVTEAGLEQVKNHASVEAYTKVGNWQVMTSDGSEYKYEYTPPESYNGSPVACIRFCLKKSNDVDIRKSEVEYVEVTKEAL